MGRPLRVRHHYYRGFPADFTAPKAAAKTFLGWDAFDDQIDLDRAALLLMHLPDTGLRPGTEWTNDCARPDLLGTVEWVPRTMDLVTNRLPPLVEAARQAKLQIVHVTMGKWYARNYEQTKRSVAEAGAPPAPTETPLSDEEVGKWHEERGWRAFQVPGTPKGAPEVEYNDFPRGLEPRDNDLVCTESWELHRLMKARGIVHLIYTGWALNWCLWFSPCGMLDMGRLRYRISAVRGGCVAIENAQSADGEKNLEYAYWKTSAMWGYVLEINELAAALRAGG